MKVQVKIEVTQIKYGTDYKGRIEIGKSTITWEIKFLIPIPKLESAFDVEPTPSLRDVFNVTMKKDDDTLELTDEEWKYFVSLLVGHVLDFHNLDQTQDMNRNRGIISDALRERKFDLGMMVKIGATFDHIYDLSDRVCMMLNGPKFDCALAT